MNNLVGIVTIIGLVIGWTVSYGSQQAHQAQVEKTVNDDSAIVQRLDKTAVRIVDVLTQHANTLTDHENRLRRIENPRADGRATVPRQNPQPVPLFDSPATGPPRGSDAPPQGHERR